LKPSLSTGSEGTSDGEEGLVTTLELSTPYGLARAHLHRPSTPRLTLVLGHGAGGGISAPDLVVALEAALAQDTEVALVEQPYRVAGRRSPAPASQLDGAWISVLEQLRAHELTDLPLVVGGRSLGARVACRTAETIGAVAVLCLAFPLVPPRRRGSTPQSRLAELDAVGLPTLVVQGERDPFGMPPAGPSRRVVPVAGDHSLRADPDAVRAAIESWLTGVIVSAT
jgi:predicted alpha/beta-hydrolase family hydrolase